MAVVHQCRDQLTHFPLLGSDVSYHIHQLHREMKITLKCKPSVHWKLQTDTNVWHRKFMGRAMHCGFIRFTP